MSEFWNALFGSTIGTLLVAGYFLTWLLIPWVLLKRKVHETAAIAWLIGILFRALCRCNSLRTDRQYAVGKAIPEKTPGFG